ncbi:P-loop containing nucleoside triphosphate hydrolase protein [Acephala macrosclerotiorum]|nr:P-loop containing nucleoside triphosphate hydrolase protein [Acephala macrosclerotiorum]
MAQHGSSLSSNTPPDSPGQSSVGTLNIEQAKEIADAIAAMKMVPAAPSLLPSSETPLGNPPPSPSRCPTCSAKSSSQVAMEFAQQLMDALKSIDSKQEPPPPPAKPSGESVQPKARASKLEFKTVNEVWDEKAYKYTIEESPKSVNEANELNQYVFVVRARIDKKTSANTVYIDIKSECLRDVLRTVLKGVHGISVKEDKPSVEQNLLYHYFPELKSHQSSTDPLDPTCAKHLDLLIQHLKATYADTKTRLLPLFMSSEIPYDLLWALFKPNTFAYTTCPGTKKPMCIKYDSGEERTTSDGVEYFHIGGRYVDFDEKVFNEVSIQTGILKFRGLKPIHSLDVFPLQYHENADQVRAELVECDQKFGSLKSVRHLQYSGKAFQVVKREPVATFVSSRIMVDAAQFRKINPNYVRPSIIKTANSGSSDSNSVDLWDWLEDRPPPPPRANEVKVNRVDLDMQDEDNLVICSPTVLGYSLNNKLWLEFAVDDITEISWNHLLWNHLAIDARRKDLTLALASSHLRQTSDHSFDDIVTGKSRGLIMLFYGPPGVGKTLTAEALSERLRRPLYTISAGDLSSDAAKLEKQLSLIFELADHWKALLLLDEADVFLRKRDTDHIHNSVVSVFLRKLEYYQGIMLFTTNRVRDFDDAIRSRIHLAFWYSPLGVDTRKGLWDTFLQNAITAGGEADYSDEELNDLARHDLNGRQIRNVVRAAHALAAQEGAVTAYSHLEIVIDAGKEFETDARGGSSESMRSYL